MIKSTNINEIVLESKVMFIIIKLDRLISDSKVMINGLVERFHLDYGVYTR